jgi:hypothetical protein
VTRVTTVGFMPMPPIPPPCIMVDSWLALNTPCKERKHHSSFRRRFMAGYTSKQ